MRTLRKGFVGLGVVVQRRIETSREEYSPRFQGALLCDRESRVSGAGRVFECEDLPAQQSLCAACRKLTEQKKRRVHRIPGPVETGRKLQQSWLGFSVKLVTPAPPSRKN